MSTVAVIGSGVVGRRVARQLAASGLVERLILGARRPQRMHGFVRQLIDVDVEVIAPGPLPAADVTVLAQPSGGHTELAEEALGNGSHVVSLSDALNDVERFSAVEHERGIAGCTLSHYEIIKKCKKDGCKNVLIFEDDVEFDEDDNFYEILDKSLYQLSKQESWYDEEDKLQ